MKTDSQMQTEVMQELRWDPSVSHEHIGVSVQDGIVTLTGSVPTFVEKSHAEACAERVAGVRSIVEKIDVVISGLNRRTDQDIANAVANALTWNTQIPDEAVHSQVSDGWVTLTGNVAWDYQRRAAENAVRPLLGVRGVTNLVRIQPATRAADVKREIENALRRGAEREARRIQVEVEGSRVVLKGTVRSFAEWREARGAAWSAPGVTEVESHLEVAA